MEYLHIFNRKYIFKGSIFQPAMLVYRSVIFSKSLIACWVQVPVPTVSNSKLPRFSWAVPKGPIRNVCVFVFLFSCDFCRSCLLPIWMLFLFENISSLIELGVGLLSENKQISIFREDTTYTSQNYRTDTCFSLVVYLHNMRWSSTWCWILDNSCHQIKFKWYPNEFKVKVDEAKN